jgi:hypothetical protein
MADDTASNLLGVAKALPLVGTAVSLIPSLYKLFAGNKQQDQAKRMLARNPGYQINNGVVDNARIIGDRYANYTLPGQTQAQNSIDNNFENAYTQGVQGASSGGDVADLAAKLAYGKNIAEGNLTAQQAQGKEALLPQLTQANAAAGQEFQNKNAYERQQYEAKLREKAGLTQAGATNEYNALDTGASVLSAYLNPKSVTTDFTNNTVGKGKPLGSLFDTPAPVQTNTALDPNFDWSKIYMRNRYNNG